MALAMTMPAMAVPVADLVAAMVPAMMIAVAIVPLRRGRRGGQGQAAERHRGGRGQFEKLHALLSFVTPTPAISYTPGTGEVHGPTERSNRPRN